MERSAYRQRQGSARTTRLARGDSPIDCRDMTGDDHLPGRVDVYGIDDLPLSRLGTRLGNQITIKTEHRSHRTLPHGHRLLHIPAAITDQGHCILKIQSASTNKGREFTKAMSGQKCRRFTATSTPQAPQGYARGKDEGLGAFREILMLLWARLREIPQVVSEHRRSLVKGLADRGKLDCRFREHPHVLGALTGEDAREAIAHLAVMLSRNSTSPL
jgi:hypothetical protein